MAVAQGVSIEWIEAKEDEIARMLTAIDDVEEVRHILRLLYKRGGMTQPVYEHTVAALTRISSALQSGKSNTAALRNGRRE